jgi:hypothetical protein
MKVNLRFIAPMLGIAALSAAANAQLVVDNFLTGETDLVVMSGTDAVESQQTGPNDSILGGQRDVLFVVQQNPFNRRNRFEIDPEQGAAFKSTGAGVQSLVQFDYDGFDDEGNDGILTPSIDASFGTGLNQSFMGQDRFRINFLEIDQRITVRIDAYTYGSADAYSFVERQVGPVNSPEAVDFLFSDFSTIQNGTMADWNDIDRLVFSFQSVDNGVDWGLTSITAVPEPTSMAAIGLGLLGLARRRRAKK